MKEPLERAIAHVGTLRKFCDLLEVSRYTVTGWRNQKWVMPAHHCVKVEKITDGQVRCEELRPDVDWQYLRESEAA